MTSLAQLLQQMRERIEAMQPQPMCSPKIGGADARAFYIRDMSLTLDALEIALGALDSICIEGSERYENTADQVPRDHLVALLVVARGKAFWARTKINELAKARGE